MASSDDDVQQVEITLRSCEGKDTLGTLVVSAEIPRSQTARTNMTDVPVRDMSMMFTRVPIKSRSDRELPIVRLTATGATANPHLLLLEETRYHVVFEPSDSSVKCTEIRLLPSIREESRRDTLVFEPWRVHVSKATSVGYSGGNLHFHSYVGKAFLDVEVCGVRSEQISFEVRSKKMDYQKHYPAMMSYLSNAASGLIFESGAPLHQMFGFINRQRNTHIEDFMFIEYLFDPGNLPQSYEHVRRNLHSCLESHSEEVPAGLTLSFGPNEVIDLFSHAECMERVDTPPEGWPRELEGYVPVSVVQRCLHETIDTPENRLVKDLLLSTERLVITLQSSPMLANYGYARDRIIEHRESLQDFLSDDWLDDVGALHFIPSNSQILQKKEGYRDLLQFYLNFEFAYRLEWDEMREQIKGFNRRLCELYEYWCYFKLVKVLDGLAGGGTSFEKLFDVNEKSGTIRVKRGKGSAQTFSIDIGDGPIKVELTYNRLFSRRTIYPSYSLPFRPDYSLMITSDRGRCFVHFDAKYRSEGDVLELFDKVGGRERIAPKDSTEEEDQKLAEERAKEEMRRRKYKDGDIYKMHTYKDAILRSEGAYILYPGDSSKVFKGVKDEDIPSVGAFPLTPGKKGEEENELARFIKAVLRLRTRPPH